MRIPFLILLIIGVASCVAAQNADASQDTLSNYKIAIPADEAAQFIGGYDSLAKFLRDNIQYPAEAQRKKIQGKVYVKIIVEQDGSLSRVEVLRGVSPELDQEAIRVISLSPTWIPGKKDGRAVKSPFIIPVNFSLAKNKR